MPARRSYLFVTFEGGGNVPPVLGVARRLAARGHDVRVLTEPCLRAAVERRGRASSRSRGTSRGRTGRRT